MSGKRVLINLVGQRFGKLVVLERAPNRGKLTAWKCQCDCGNVKDIMATSLSNNGRSRSCGCLRKAQLVERSKTHGKSNHSMYSTWKGMHQRCSDMNAAAYINYGGRGINVCNRWSGANGFPNFLDDMGDKPTGMTLDRIDNDGDYDPFNCRWVSWKMQAQNRRPKKPRKDRFFSDESVRIIRRTKVSTALLARITGVSEPNIAAIRKKRIYKDVA